MHNVQEPHSTPRTRILRSDQEKLVIIQRQKSSNLSVKDFCKQEGIYESQFYSWRTKLSPKEKNDFYKLTPLVNKTPLTIILPNGVRIESAEPLSSQLIDSLKGV